MGETDVSRDKRGLSIAAGAFFVLAVLGAAYPAFKAGPATGPGLLLLLGLGVFAVLGLVGFAPVERRLKPDSEEAAQAVLRALPEPACVLALDGRVVAANASWSEARQDGLRLQGGPELFVALQQARREGASTAELTIGGERRAAAVSRLAENRLLLRLDRQAEPPKLLTDQSAPQAPAAAASDPLAGASASLDAFAAAAPFGAALLDGEDALDALIVETNPALDALTDHRGRPGAPFGELFDPASRAELQLRLAAAKPGKPLDARLAGGRIAHLYLTRAQGRTVAYLLDVSEQKQLELQLAQSQKMQAIGQLAGGVAHDFNNLLTAIQLRLDELLHRHPAGDPSYEGLNEIRQTSLRAADLIRKLLAFSRKQTVQRETLKLGELISEFEVLLRRLLREDVKLVTDYGRDLPEVRADKSQLETAVMNLAVNARDALRSHGAQAGQSPTVRIRTARLTQLEARALGHPEPPAEGCALIEVADNGPGIAPDVQAKIFEPFFTTKPVGEGTGLGLATVYGIVKQADGWIHLASAPGEGAAFRVFLPIHQAPAVTAPALLAAAPKPKPAARDLSGAGRILFVEDEDAVRGIAARLLRARGYEVIEAADGEAALDLAQQHAGQIDLLISDVIMPGLDGPSLLKKARPYLGDAPVMFISGYAEAEFSDLLEGEEGLSFLPKPLDIKALAERVKQQLQPA